MPEAGIISLVAAPKRAPMEPSPLYKRTMQYFGGNFASRSRMLPPPLKPYGNSRTLSFHKVWIRLHNVLNAIFIYTLCRAKTQR